MTVSWLPGAETQGRPESWADEGGELHCLSCRRDRAGDEAIDDLPDGAPPPDRQRARSNARIEFEIERDPERPDNRIANACHTSTLAVRKARMRLHQRTQPRA